MSALYGVLPSSNNWRFSNICTRFCWTVTCDIASLMNMTCKIISIVCSRDELDMLIQIVCIRWSCLSFVNFCTISIINRLPSYLLLHVCWQLFGEPVVCFLKFEHIVFSFERVLTQSGKTELPCCELIPLGSSRIPGLCILLFSTTLIRWLQLRFVTLAAVAVAVYSSYYNDINVC